MLRRRSLRLRSRIAQLTKCGSDVIISWNTNASGYTLEATAVLTLPVTWTNAGAGTVIGDKYVLTNAATDARSYHLKE